MNDRQGLEAIVAVVCKYLPPDGISREDAMREIIGLVDPLPEQPEQKPVCWITPDEKGFRMRYEPPINDVPLGWTALYDAPPSKPWVGLSDTEINKIVDLNTSDDGGFDIWCDGIAVAHIVCAKIKKLNK